MTNSVPKSVDECVTIRVPESAGTLYERIQYPAGELQVRLTDRAISTLYSTQNVRVICRSAHQHLMELALLSDALHALVGGIDSTLILPYLPYGRADRRFTEGDCHGLQTFGRILSHMCYNRIRTLDVHSFRAAKNVANLVDVSARPFITRAMADIADRTGHLPALLLPDAGAVRYKFSQAVQCTKKRDAITGKLSGFEVPYFERDSALIVDDICDGGGTFVGLAHQIAKGLAYRRGNCWDSVYSTKPKRLSLYVTHGIFSKGLDELFNWFEKIYTTDSIYPAHLGKPNILRPHKLEVYDCEPLLLETR